MVPSNPAAVHASLAALTLPWGLSLRNSFKKLVLPGVAVAVLGSLGADFSLAAVLEFPPRLPVRFIFALVLLTKLVLTGVTVAVPGMLEAAFSLAAFLVFPRRLPVSPSCFRTWLMMG